MLRNLLHKAPAAEPTPAATELSQLASCLQHSITALESDCSGSHLARLRVGLEDFEGLIPPPTAPSTSNDERPMYLDLLPQGPLENILRHLSERPRSLQWEKHVDPKVAQAMYCGTGALTLLFRRKFPHVNVTSDFYRSKPPTGSPKVFSTVEMPLNCRTWDSGSVKVLQASGGSITGITCTADRNARPAPHLVTWIDPFLKHCHNLKSLDVKCMCLPFFEKIIQRCGPTLESLAMDNTTSSTAHIDCIAKHCFGLRRFSTVLRTATPLHVWPTIGAKLEDLRFVLTEPNMNIVHGSHYSYMQQMLGSIEKHCRRIRRITANPVCSAAFPALASLVGSYGEQLEYAKLNFSYMASDLCRSIAGKCPNAEFALTYLTRMSVIEDLNYQCTN